MYKNTLVLSLLLLTGCAVGQTTYQSPTAYHSYTAPVVSSTPVVQEYTVERQECRTEIVQRQQPGIAGAIIGGAIGAALGNQVGGGSGKQIATAAGAVAGAAIGNQEQNGPRQVQVCEPYYETLERIVGYRVTYLIGDRQFTETLSYSPGSTVRVQLVVQ